MKDRIRLTPIIAMFVVMVGCSHDTDTPLETPPRPAETPSALTLDNSESIRQSQSTPPPSQQQIDGGFGNQINSSSEFGTDSFPSDGLGLPELDTSANHGRDQGPVDPLNETDAVAPAVQDPFAVEIDPDFSLIDPSKPQSEQGK
jgi:hypothetical protein